VIRRLLERLRARLRPATVAPSAPAPVASETPSSPARLRLVPYPGRRDDPAGVVLIRGGEVLVLDYAEVALLAAELPRLLDSLARFSPHYQPAEDAPPAAPIN